MSEPAASPIAPEPTSAKGAAELAHLHALIDRFTDLLRHGCTRSEARYEVGIPVTVASWLSRELGWSMDWRTHYCGRLSHRELVERYNAGASMSQLATVAGVSRQRVEQALRAADVDTLSVTAARHEARQDAMMQKQAELRTKKKSAAVARDEEKYQSWRIAWEQGRTLNEMSKLFGVPMGTIVGYVSQLRKKYGWFPYRRPSSQRTPQGEPARPLPLPPP